jgi:hypothetical protein
LLRRSALPPAPARPQVFYCLRNGWWDRAARAASLVHDLLPVRPGEQGLRGVLDEWARGGGRVADKCAGRIRRLRQTAVSCRRFKSRPSGRRTADKLARACEALLRDKAALKTQVRPTGPLAQQTARVRQLPA